MQPAPSTPPTTARTFADKVLEMFMTAPQITARGVRIPSDMSARAHTTGSWAHISEFPVVRPTLPLKAA
ncbi:hypothetical protein H310_11270 [Aphanomyces invadans]|uniref:Uncharacterized protein n=1 Tax=Aphanomyces invadans TaxID=157072 RepID=A0A024TN35_9STRA|nr:hypothetical protein H310_11270 [Aphanomyces invadans]ETV95389.1 hypothetical protein H310_11270 [Aphanomyces invadans]|eukprot:XP_008876090.1 hypothetical protein H310_11270 [Aphanomyces invadans]